MGASSILEPNLFAALVGLLGLAEEQRSEPHESLGREMKESIGRELL
jgi:hypothetical protein